MSRRYACQLRHAIDRAARLRKITSLRRTCAHARNTNVMCEPIHTRVKKSLLCLRPFQRKKPLIGQVATPAREVYGTQRRVFATRTHTAVCISRAEKLRHACTHARMCTSASSIQRNTKSFSRAASFGASSSNVSYYITR